jgi:NAD-dependent deacetylase
MPAISRCGLEKRGKLHALITQKIDELHEMAGNSPAKVIEVHGGVRKVVCMDCVGAPTPGENASIWARAPLEFLPEDV